MRREYDEPYPNLKSSSRAWKGDAQYFTVKIGDTLAPDAAFSSPDPRPVSIKRVGRDYSSYVAFWKDVHVVE